MYAKLTAHLIAAGLALGAGPVAQARSADPVYVAGSQYTAILQQTQQRWRLLPLDGDDFEIGTANPACSTPARLPRGVWLVRHAESGQLELIAPSFTALPAGAADRVGLRACGDGAAPADAIAAPQLLLDYLGARTGAVYVED